MADRNPAMNDEIRTYIVQCVACFDTPTVVVGQVKEEFGVTVTPQAVQAYDPTKYAGKGLSKKWKALFEETRKAFLDDVAQIPIANRSSRLRTLQRLATRAEKQGNLALVAQFHKQAAEEMGNAFTNRREVTGKDGTPLPTAAPAVAIFALPDNGRG